jgi:hypothetical protein
MGDLNRDQLFGDPLPNVHKIIYVTHHGITTVYNEMQSYLFTIL